MIRLSRDQLRHISDHVSGAYPNEGCGLLVGRDDGDGALSVSRVVTSANVAPERTQDRFEVDPQVRINLEIELRNAPESGERLIGHFHSHPDHAARPSETDLERAFEPALVWLITSVEKGRAGATKAYTLAADGKRFIEVEISIADEQA